MNAAAALLTATAVLFAARAARLRLFGSGSIDRTQQNTPARGPRGRGGLLLGMLNGLGRALPGLVAALALRQSAAAIDRAGLGGRITPRDIAAARVACLFVALALVPRMVTALPPRLLPLALPVMLWSAAEIPMFLLARRAAKRAVAMRSALPDALDLLRACLGAGLPLRRSLALVAEHCAEPVAGEIAWVAAETAYGTPQGEALARLAERNPEPEVRAMVSAMRQAERGGSPLAPLIAAQARDARLAFNREIVERGARAGPKIQLIVSATIVPGALIAFAAIVVAGVARGEIKIF